MNAINDNYIAGYTEAGRMSVVRRFFCLFVAFDLFFISLLWLICIMVSTIVRFPMTAIIALAYNLTQMHGDTIQKAFREQVLEYTIQSSLFDIVTMALIRFVFLNSFYGLFRMNHWIIIAVS